MLNQEDLEKIQKLITKSLMDFWEKFLEPNVALKADVEILKTDVGVIKQDMDVLKKDVGGLKQDVGVLKQDMEEVKLKVGSIDRKLTAEVNYRDNLEKRMQKVEKKVGIA